MDQNMFTDAEFHQLRSHYNDIAAHLQEVYCIALKERESEQFAMLTVVKHLEVLVELGKLDLKGMMVFLAYMIRRSATNQRALVTSLN